MEIKLYDYEDEYGWPNVVGMGNNSGDVISNAIEAAEGQPLTLRISSVGGSCYAAIQIITAIKKHGDVTAQIDGVCFSAAAVIAAACKSVTGYTTIMMMIHNARINADMWGTYTAKDLERLFEQEKAQLEAFDNLQRQILIAKTGLADDVVTSMLDQETWLTGQEGKDLGFIDVLIDGETEAITRNLYEKTFANAPMRMVALAGKSLKIKENNNNMSLIDDIKAEFADLKALFTPKAEGDTVVSPPAEEPVIDYKAEYERVQAELDASKAETVTAKDEANSIVAETRALLAEVRSNYKPAAEAKDFNTKATEETPSRFKAKK